jgi:hypothetical protein
MHSYNQNETRKFQEKLRYSNKIISTFNIVPQNYYYSSKRILIFIVLNCARTFMINDK